MSVCDHSLRQRRRKCLHMKSSVCNGYLFRINPFTHFQYERSTDSPIFLNYQQASRTTVSLFSPFSVHIHMGLKLINHLNCTCYMPWCGRSQSLSSLDILDDMEATSPLWSFHAWDSICHQSDDAHV